MMDFLIVFSNDSLFPGSFTQLANEIHTLKNKQPVYKQHNSDMKNLIPK